MKSNNDVPMLASRTAYSDRRLPQIEITHGVGAYLYDKSGNRYLDAASGSGSLIFGHGDRRSISMITEQLSRLSLFPSRNLDVGVTLDFATSITRVAPEGFDKVITYSSGSDAVEAAAKLAIQWHQCRGNRRRVKILGRRGSYHGNTLTGLGAGGFIARREPFEAALAHYHKASEIVCRPGHDCERFAEECARTLERAIALEGSDTVAAFIVEPIVGAALSGAVPCQSYLGRVRQICDWHDILLIFDEVMTGFGRTGKVFALEHFFTLPDIIVMGKAMGAGYFPLSGILVSSKLDLELASKNQYFQNGQTNTWNPVGCALALSVVQRLEEEGISDNAQKLGAEVFSQLSETAQAYGWRLQGRGLMIGLVLDERRHKTECSPGAVARRLEKLCLERGLIVYGSSGNAKGRSGDHILLLPPLNISSYEGELICSVLADTLKML